MKEEIKCADTYLTEENINMLKAIFGDEEQYRYYMKCLWILRALTMKKCEKKKTDGWLIDDQDEAYPLYETANDLISCLLQDGIIFDGVGNMIKV